MAEIKVIKPGVYTTIQDLGRYGFQKSGMPVAGAMDAFSLKVANMLVGNGDNEACFEITLLGPELRFDSDSHIAVTGADLSPMINGKDIYMWSKVKVSKGDILSFGKIKSGCRSYIAVGGGIDVPAVMGSKSTYVRGKIGGYEGRLLKEGDEIRTGIPNAKGPEVIKLPAELIPVYENGITARVVLGPQDDFFTKEGMNTFLSSEYRVTNEVDRMGYRLEGPKITHKDGADIVSDGITMGSIQVPGHGSPIVMMADRQTTGGYTKIATVITPDIDCIGQLKPGDKVRFKFVSLEEAHSIYRDYIKKIEMVRDFILKTQYNIIDRKFFRVIVNSIEFEVLVEEIEQWKIS